MSYALKDKRSEHGLRRTKEGKPSHIISDVYYNTLLNEEEKKDWSKIV